VSTPFHLMLAGAAVAGLALVQGLISGQTPHSPALLEIQTGPVILAIGQPEHPVSLLAHDTCLSEGCPVLAIRVRSPAAPQIAPQQPRRVQRIEARTLKRQGVATQSANERFSQ